MERVPVYFHIIRILRQCGLWILNVFPTFKNFAIIAGLYFLYFVLFSTWLISLLLSLEKQNRQRICLEDMQVAEVNLVADINLPTCADHVVSWVVSYRAWRGKNSLCYCGKRSSKCFRHFLLLPSQHAYKLNYPITPYALAVHKTRWRRSGVQVNRNDRQFRADVSVPYLWCSLYNALLARKIPNPNCLMVRTISVSSSKQTYSKYNLSLWHSASI